MSTTLNIIAPPPPFDKAGWPINPTTGETYSPNEIRAASVTDIPYPLHVDPEDPGPYWQRRSPAELAAQKRRIAKKSKARRGRRRSHQTRLIPMRFQSSAGQQAEKCGLATAELVSRVNEGEEAEAVTWQSSLADLSEVTEVSR